MADLTTSADIDALLAAADNAAARTALGLGTAATTAATDYATAAQGTDARTPTAHAASHTNGTDDIQNATASVKGLATAAQIAKLDGIEAAADVTDATNVAAVLAAADTKSPPIDADVLPFLNSEGSFELAKFTLANLKAFIKTYFDTLYQAAGSYLTSGGALGTPSSGTLTNCTGLPVAGLASFVGLPWDMCVALSNETTDLTTGLKVSFYAPYALTLTAFLGSVTTAGTGSTIIMDVHVAGTTVMSTNKISIDASELNSTTAATAPGITTTSVAQYALVECYIDQIGATIAGAGAKIHIYATRA